MKKEKNDLIHCGYTIIAKSICFDGTFSNTVLGKNDNFYVVWDELNGNYGCGAYFRVDEKKKAIKEYLERIDSRFNYWL